MVQETEIVLWKNLKEMGGRYWEKGLFRRVYFNKGTLLSIMGVDIDQVKEIAKSDISRVGPEKKLLNALDCTKVYPSSCWWARLELNQRCFSCHGFTDRCARQLRVLTHMAESAELESDTMRCDPLSGRSPDLLGSLSKYGWGGWIRTNKCRCQRPVP